MEEIFSEERYELEYLSKGYILGGSELRMREEAIKTLDYSLYKKLFLEYYPRFRNGKFSGKIVSINNNIIEYELVFILNEPLLKEFKKIWLLYTVNENEKKVILKAIKPDDITTVASIFEKEKANEKSKK